MVAVSFLKKLGIPSFSLKLFRGKPQRMIGIDIGVYSTKVVQLRYETERAILETYGELLNEPYWKTGTGIGGGFLRYQDEGAVALLKNILRESRITTLEAVLAIPATASFTVIIPFPRITRREVEHAIPYEARKYIPIPISEVILDWEILETAEERELTEVLLVAVPREVVERCQHIGETAGIKIQALEVETFSLVRSLGRYDLAPTALINFGHQSTTFSIIDQGRLRVSHTVNRGSQELTQALERGLGVNRERAETIKKDVGLSERIEEREISSVIAPLTETLFSEIDRLIHLSNRRLPRKIQKINLTGGGANLKGIIEAAASHFGVEVTRGNPFARIVAPPFMQPVLREIGPSFSVAVGLALHGISTR